MSNLSPEEFFQEEHSLKLGRAIYQDDLPAVRLAASSVDLNKVQNRQMTFLFYAITCKHLEIASELIKLGASPSLVSEGLGSPLDVAVRAKEADILQMLLDAGVSPNALNSWGTPLLFEASCNDSTKPMKLLVQRGADLDLKEPNLGRTALFEAFSHNCYDQVEYLIRRGASVDITLLNSVTFAYSLQRRLTNAGTGTPAEEKLLLFKKIAMERGIQFPADPPPVVRAQMKAQGLKVIE